MSNYLVSYWNYKLETSRGGIGDKFLGIISTLMISKKLNLNFKICWLGQNIENYFIFWEEPINPTLFSTENSYHFDHINFKSESKRQDLFSFKYNLISAGSEISHFFYSDEETQLFYTQILELYKNFYEKILIPREIIINNVDYLLKDYNSKIPLIGIQIRMGDWFMKDTGKSFRVRGTRNKVDNINLVSSILKELHKIINSKYSDFYIFITSDFLESYHQSLKIFDPDKIIYNNLPISHAGQSKNINFIKIIADHYILSKKCQSLYISKESNFGRTAGVINQNDEVFDLEGNYLDKKILISKTPVLFDKFI